LLKLRKFNWDGAMGYGTCARNMTNSSREALNTSGFSSKTCRVDLRILTLSNRQGTLQNRPYTIWEKLKSLIAF
jgi:hypothetical protein